MYIFHTYLRFSFMLSLHFPRQSLRYLWRSWQWLSGVFWPLKPYICFPTDVRHTSRAILGDASLWITTRRSSNCMHPSWRISMYALARFSTASRIYSKKHWFMIERQRTIHTHSLGWWKSCWVDGGGWMYGQIDVRADGCMGRWMIGWMYLWVHGCMGWRIDGLILPWLYA